MNSRTPWGTEQDSVSKHKQTNKNQKKYFGASKNTMMRVERQSGNVFAKHIYNKQLVSSIYKYL